MGYYTVERDEEEEECGLDRSQEQDIKVERNGGLKHSSSVLVFRHQGSGNLTVV